MVDIHDFHKELLYLLKELDAICSKHDIKYSLFAGTLIGAIRHKGFIPWDDDADVIFERSEFDKLLAVLPSDFNIKRNSWVQRFSLKTNPKIFIDIFIFDATSNVKIFQKLQVTSLKFIQGILKNKITKDKGVFGTIISSLLYLIGLPFSENFKLKVYRKFAKMFNHKKSNYIFSSLDQFKYIGKVLPNKILNSYSKVDFEGNKLMIMDGYDLYLKKFYGDYMKLPKIENQKPAHGDFRKRMNV